MASGLALVATLWLHVVLAAGTGPLVGHAPLLAFDFLATLPIAGLAVWVVGTYGHRLGLRAGSGTNRPRQPAAVATTWLRRAFLPGGAVALLFAALFAPLSVVLGYAHGVIGAPAAVAAHHVGHAALPAVPGLADLPALAGYGLGQALAVWPAVLVAALAGVLVLRLATDRRARRRLRARLRALPRPATVAATAGALVAGIGLAALLPASPAAAQAGGCDIAPQRTYDVAAVNVEITVNRHGDYDPWGFMYVLESNLPALRAEEAALQAASQTEDIVDEETGEILTSWPEQVAQDPNARTVSAGLGQDLIQPLVLRARLGECVIIKLRNALTRAPVTGPAARLIEVPGGVPHVSIDMQGVSYDAQGGHGGQPVGNTGGSAMTQPGQIKEYKFYLDPLMGEGTKVFRSGGESTQLTAHGLFGALIAEPSGARWFDPVTGQERTNNSNWSNWVAMVSAPGQPTFREFAILYHEVGDESFTLRRPLREDFGPGNSSPSPDPFDPSANPRLIGGSLMMVDRRVPDIADPFFRGGGTNSYRPGSRALNYRAESFFRRLQHETLLVNQAGGEGPEGQAEAREEQTNNKSLSYSSYTYGDPATPIARSYLGEPTKTRLAHVGFQQLHVHHLHGGATRWRQNPGADNTDIAGGLKKVPVQDAQSIRLDSQTISPEESFTLEHECGAGGCQQGAGDYLFHCHIAHHYISGMWGIWRVFDTAQPDLATLPGASPPPTSVTSAQLLGTTLRDGRTVVLDSQVTNPNTQVGLQTLVEGQLPPQGVRNDKHDATVWDWDVTGPGNAPVYQGEPEDTLVWENYRSPAPGQRIPIRFNPVTGKTAYPLFTPHLGQRPPFTPDEHTGTPHLGDDVGPGRPDGLCDRSRGDLRGYDITATSVNIPMTEREVDTGGMLFVLNENREDLENGVLPADPLVVRSNVGDCTEITFGNTIDTDARAANNHRALAKTNMHTHFVQFDIQGSDGVVTGFNYETSIFPAQREDRTLVGSHSAGADIIEVNHTNGLRPGISVAVGLGDPNIEIRTIVAIAGNELTLDRQLDNNHAAGEWVSVEFLQHRWYSDVDSGTVFWHDHVDGIISWAHGLFAAHIIEPAGSTYHDPVTGQPVQSGTIVDVRNTQGGSVGVGQSGSFREFVIFLHNGRPASQAPNNFVFGQECEESSINLRAAPFGERTPPGDLVFAPAPDPENPDILVDTDPATTDQRFQFNGHDPNNSCRNVFDRTSPSRTNTDTVAATVTTVDPHVFSSVVYGDPVTPLLRAYAGDDVVIRTIGLGERAEALRFQGHRFRMERFNQDGQLMDTAVTGISERFDYVLDGGAGGPQAMAGDYLYHTTRNFGLESGGWGIFRVHDTVQGNLQPLPDNAPASGQGFPVLSPNNAANPQANPGQPPPTPSAGNVSHNVEACANPNISYDITVFDHPLPTAPFVDTEGIVYALTSDVAAIRGGQQPVEPLVLRANAGQCVQITLRNDIDPGSLYGGTRAGLDLGMLSRNPQLSGGAAVGLNPDTTVGVGQNRQYRFLADQQLGSVMFTNLGSPASVRHGAYGMLIVEPTNSTWFNSSTGQQLGANQVASQAVIRVPGQPDFREFAITLHTTDQHFTKSVVPYMDVVAGSGINPPREAGGGQPTLRPAPIAGAPPGTTGSNGAYNKGFTHVSYRSEPLTARIGLTNAPGHLDLTDPDEPAWFDDDFQVDHPYHTSFSSQVHGDPATPILRAIAGDRVVLRVGVGGSDQLHSFVVSGHVFPLEPGMTGSQLMTSRTITTGQTLDAWLVGGAGGIRAYPGDYAFRDSRQPFTGAGLWGIFRVQVTGSGGIIPL